MDYGRVAILTVVIEQILPLMIRIGRLAESTLMRVPNVYAVVLFMRYDPVAAAIPFTFGLIGRKNNATVW